MNTERLLKLASFLRKLPPERFDFGVVVNHNTPRCGTVGCAIGWTPAVFPELVEWKTGSRDQLRLTVNHRNSWFEEVAQVLFDMDKSEAMNLFTPGYQCELELEDLDNNATPSQVADLIEEYIKLKS